MYACMEGKCVLRAIVVIPGVTFLKFTRCYYKMQGRRLARANRSIRIISARGQGAAEGPSGSKAKPW